MAQEGKEREGEREEGEVYAFQPELLEAGDVVLVAAQGKCFRLYVSLFCQGNVFSLMSQPYMSGPRVFSYMSTLSVRTTCLLFFVSLMGQDKVFSLVCQPYMSGPRVFLFLSAFFVRTTCFLFFVSLMCQDSMFSLIYQPYVSGPRVFSDMPA